LKIKLYNYKFRW